MIVQQLYPSEQERLLLESREADRHVREVPDFRDVTVVKPWGEEYLLFENSDAAIWILRIDPAGSTSFHAHPRKTTSLIVLGGRSGCETLGAAYSFGMLEAIILGRGVFHCSFNTAQEPLYLMEIESPVDKFDLVRHKDAYGREGTGYEAQERYEATPGSYMASGSRRIGEATVTIAFAPDREAFLERAAGLHDAIITILDRHIWSAEGEKLVEVGSSFRLEELGGEFRINDRFHYVIIHKNGEEAV